MKIRGKRVLINNVFKLNTTLIIEEDKIIDICQNFQEKVDFEFDIIAPGFIDNHTHGGGGHDFMEANQKAFDEILKNKVTVGTTSLFATSITQSINNIKKMINYTKKHIHQEGQSQILGIHLEGPFVSKEKKGAQPEKFILDCDPDLLQEFYNESEGFLKIITYAPEHDKDFKLTKLCDKLNIKAQLGHTIANQEIINQAIKNGASGITHAYNAMPKSLKNETTGFLAKSHLYGEIICDGFHNTYQQIIDFINLKGLDKTILMTDSLMCAGCEDGEYLLGGEMIYKKGIEIRLKSNNIAGSVVGMIDVVKNLVLNTNILLEDALQMASLNVAKYHNLKTKGAIKIGNEADLVALTDKLNLQMTMVLGKIAFLNKEKK